MSVFSHRRCFHHKRNTSQLTLSIGLERLTHTVWEDDLIDSFFYIRRREQYGQFCISRQMLFITSVLKDILIYIFLYIRRQFGYVPSIRNKKIEVRVSRVVWESLIEILRFTIQRTQWEVFFYTRNWDLLLKQRITHWTLPLYSLMSSSLAIEEIPENIIRTNIT